MSEFWGCLSNADAPSKEELQTGCAMMVPSSGFGDLGHGCGPGCKIKGLKEPRRASRVACHFCWRRHFVCALYRAMMSAW